MKNLLELIAKNPNLPVVPMVGYDVCSGEYDYSIGRFGNSEVCEYAIYNWHVYFDEEELKEEYYNNNDECYAGMTDEEAEISLEQDIEHLWTKAIIVYIEPL
jgi:hypothetical protein